MPNLLKIAISGPDRVGLVSAVTARLYDLGGNFGDTSFAVLGEGAEFASLCELPDGVDAAAAEQALADLPELAGARIEVRPFALPGTHAPAGLATHRIEARGRDRPGLLARLTEVLVEYGANIVRLNADRLLGEPEDVYLMRFAVAIPPERAEACLNALHNTASQLGHSLTAEPAA
jgi:glycine cleavage system transcriptional repressor